MSAAPVRVLLLGYGHLGLALLQGLLETPNCEVVGVYCWSTRKKGASGWEPEEAKLQKLASQRKIPKLDCGSVNSYEFAEVVQTLKPDIIQIGSWGEILKAHLLETGEYYVVNCHPSLLPKHRGANPYVSAIRTGEPETGVSFHRVDTGVDTGPILLQAAVPIAPEDTGIEVRDKCAIQARTLVGRVIEHYRQGTIQDAEPQDESQQSYFGQLKMEEGQIHWPVATSAQVLNQIRGMYPWLPAYCFIESQIMLSITRATSRPRQSTHQYPPGTVVGVKNGTVWVATSDLEVEIGLSRYRVYWGAGFTPEWLTRIMSPLLFRVGTRLGYPHWQ